MVLGLVCAIGSGVVSKLPGMKEFQNSTVADAFGKGYAIDDYSFWQSDRGV